MKESKKKDTKKKGTGTTSINFRLDNERLEKFEKERKRLKLGKTEMFKRFIDSF